MAGEHLFHRTLKQRVEELRELRRQQLAEGAAKDYAEYRQSVGYFLGLTDALRLAEEIEREMDPK